MSQRHKNPTAQIPVSESRRLNFNALVKPITNTPAFRHTDNDDGGDDDEDQEDEEDDDSLTTLLLKRHEGRTF